MLVLRFLFKGLILGAITRLLRFFPIGRRLLRLIWR